MRQRVVVEVPEATTETTETTKTTTATATTPKTTKTAGGSDPVSENVNDVRDRLLERLESAKSAGIVDDIGVSGRRRSSAPSKKDAEEAVDMLQGMDLKLLSSMFWKAVSHFFGWDKAGCPVEEGDAENWGDALAPVISKFLGALADEHAEEITLLAVTVIIFLPRMLIAYDYKKEQKQMELAA